MLKRRLVALKNILSEALCSDTEETLAIIESLDIDNYNPTEEEIAQKFGWEDDYYANRLNWWQRTKPQLWAIFDDGWSSSKKCTRVCINLPTP